jgi:hypothetical protein
VPLISGKMNAFIFISQLRIILIRRAVTIRKRKYKENATICLNTGDGIMLG